MAKAVKLTDVSVLCIRCASLVSASVPMHLDEKHRDVCLAQHFGPAPRIGRERWKHPWTACCSALPVQVEALFWVAEGKIRKKKKKKKGAPKVSKEAKSRGWR